MPESPQLLCIRSVSAAAVDEDGAGDGRKMLWEQRNAAQQPEEQKIREGLYERTRGATKGSLLDSPLHTPSHATCDFVSPRNLLRR